MSADPLVLYLHSDSVAYSPTLPPGHKLKTDLGVDGQPNDLPAATLEPAERAQQKWATGA